MVETSRFIIIPLDQRQLRLYLHGKRKLDQELNIAHINRKISSEVRDRGEYLILPEMKRASGDNYLFFTFWIVIEKASRYIVAEMGFKGIPNNNKEVEIGYGVFTNFHRKGIMTECVRGMIDWAKKRLDIQYVLAETDENNLASIKVLQKNNFQNFDKKGKMIWWKIEVNPTQSH